MHLGKVYGCSIDEEDPNSYATGRFFPVELGNRFKHGRYQVLHKLGWGGFATIWLARDNVYVEPALLFCRIHSDCEVSSTETNVALKFINTALNKREHQILRHLQTSRLADENASHPGRDAVVQLLDDFAVDSTHMCLVLEVLGDNLRARTDKDKHRRLPKVAAQSIVHQVALGVDYLWRCGVAHGGNAIIAADKPCII